MEENSDVIQKRKDNLKKFFFGWVKDHYDKAFLGVLIVAISIRLYYFFMTLNQPVWWDEAEYLNMAKAMAFGLKYEFLSVRPVLFSLIIAGFYKFTSSEFLPRIFLLILSIASVIGTYLVGKEIYDKQTGLIASSLMSVFYLNLFFSFRLLVDLISLTFFIFSSLFFYKYLKKNSNKDLYIGTVIIAVGTLFRITTAVFLFCFLFYLLFTQRLSFLKKKELWIAGIIFILILSPYLLWGYFKFNGLIITQAARWNAPKDNSIENVWWNLSSYLRSFSTYLSWPLLILFFLGALSICRIFLGIDLFIKGKMKNINKELFLILLFIFPLLITSISFDHHIEDRYILNSFLALFIISGQFILTIYDYLKKKKKIFAIIFLIILLSFIFYFQLKSADSLIKLKETSYLEIKEAGLWFKEHSNATDIMISGSVPQMKYYSNREILNFPSTEQEFESMLSSDESIKFFMISGIEQHPDWVYAYSQKEGLNVVKYYPSVQNSQQISVIIYGV